MKKERNLEEGEEIGSESSWSLTAGNYSQPLKVR